MFLKRFSPLLLILGVSFSVCACWKSITPEEYEFEDPVSISNLDWWLHGEIGSMVYVSWEQDGPGTMRVEYQVDDEWFSTPTFVAEAGSQEQLVVGIPYGMSADWRVVQSGQNGVNGQTITTAVLPEGLPLAEIHVSDEDGWYDKGRFLLTSINEFSGGWTGGTYWTFIIDRQARPVWAKKTPLSNWTIFAQVAVSGDHILIDEASKWNIWDEGAASLVRFRYLDADIDLVSTPGLHHAFVQLPDGTLAWGSQFHGGGEALAEKAPGATSETVIWTANDDWPGTSNNVESNGLFYQEETDSYIYSFYTNDSIVEVARQDGSSVWWAGEVPGGYDFSPPSSQYNWQHGISYTNEGTLLVSTRAAGNSGSTTPVYEYEVDHNAETLTLIWSYDPGVHAQTNGDAWRLSNGNTLHLLGSASHIFEVDPNGETVWHLEFEGTRLLGRGEFIEDLHTLITPR